MKSSPERVWSQESSLPLMVILPPLVLLQSMSCPSTKKAGVPERLIRLPIPISKLIFLETFSEARSSLNFSRSPFLLVTSVKYWLNKVVRSDGVAYSHSVWFLKRVSAYSFQ